MNVTATRIQFMEYYRDQNISLIRQHQHNIRTRMRDTLIEYGMISPSPGVPTGYILTDRGRKWLTSMVGSQPATTE